MVQQATIQDTNREFMEAVKEDRDYELVNPHGGDVVDKISAKKVYQMIVELAWKNGEPGLYS